MTRIIFCLLLVSITLSAQHTDASLLNKKWAAQWIAHPTAPAREYGVYHFRKNFDLSDTPQSFIVHVSADNRYKLYVNGQFAGNGPARGDQLNWRFETVDIAQFLHTGKNTIAAQVWFLGDWAPWAQMHEKAAFIIQGDSDKEAIINTNDSWLVMQNPAYSPTNKSRMQKAQFNVIGPGDRLDANQYPWGWQATDFNDSNWQTPKSYGHGKTRGFHDAGMPWLLVPRTIPAMEFTDQQFHSVRRQESIYIPQEFLTESAAIEIPAHQTCSFLLDQNVLTMGYPNLTVSGGKNAEITLIYAEALFDENGQKGNRNEIKDKNILGIHDSFIADGGRDRTFTPLWIRCWRYVKVEIITKEEPILLQKLNSTFSAYPFEQKAVFQTDDEQLTKIWDVGWRTARLCAGENYFDCPYYEQLQYVGDTRIQALISLYNSGDDRLMRNAIQHFADSRFHAGLTTSRFPSRIHQVIPPYSLFWISMIYDYWMHRDDTDFIRPLLSGIEGVLDWYERHIDTTGMLGPMPFWNFVDWPNEWAWDNKAGIGGVPSGAEDGNSSIITFQYIYVLQQAEALMRSFNRNNQAEHYKTVAADLRQRVHALCWDQQKQMYADTPEKKDFSQHANVTAVLCGMPQDVDQKKFIRKIVADDQLIQCTLYYRFYLTQALLAAGAAQDYLDSLKPWNDMLQLGLTTFAERPEPTRSDCHAWSASPNYDFLSLVCGITPAEPGFKSVKIEPALGKLKNVRAEMPHPLGSIKVMLQRKGKTGIYAEIELPEKCTGTFIWQGQRKACASGTTVIKF